MDHVNVNGVTYITPPETITLCGLTYRLEKTTPADSESAARDECAAKLVALLRRRGPLTGRQARNGITARLRPYAREVLDDLAHTGTLTTTGGAWSTARYAAPAKEAK